MPEDQRREMQMLREQMRTALSLPAETIATLAPAERDALMQLRQQLQYRA